MVHFNVNLLTVHNYNINHVTISLHGILLIYVVINENVDTYTYYVSEM